MNKKLKFRHKMHNWKRIEWCQNRIDNFIRSPVILVTNKSGREFQMF